MTTLITGANRGVGAALLAKYHAAGMDAVGTSRGADDLLDLEVNDAASFAALAKTLDGKPIQNLICNSGVLLDKGWGLDDCHFYRHLCSQRDRGVRNDPDVAAKRQGRKR